MIRVPEKSYPGSGSKREDPAKFSVSGRHGGHPVDSEQDPPHQIKSRSSAPLDIETVTKGIVSHDFLDTVQFLSSFVD